MASIRLNQLRKDYGSVVAVDGVDLEIHDKEFVVMLGPSGCGKTTTLRCIAGLEDATGGEIRFGDKVVNRLSPADRNIAMVFQFYALYPHLNARENILFPLKAEKMGQAEMKRQLEWVVGLLSLEHLLNRRVSHLSDGDKQKVALARAIVRKPQALLLDEPLSALDEKYREQMRAELKRLQKSFDVTTIYVTHDQREAMTLADRIVVMRDGKIIEVGHPEELYEKPRNSFTGYFIGSPGMNFMEGEVQEGKGFLVDGGEQVSLSKTLAKRLVGQRSSRMVLGVRPEHMSFQTTPAEGGNWIAVELSTIETIRDVAYGSFHFGGKLHRCIVDESVGGEKKRGYAILEEESMRFYEPESGELIEVGAR